MGALGPKLAHSGSNDLPANLSNAPGLHDGRGQPTIVGPCNNVVRLILIRMRLIPRIKLIRLWLILIQICLVT